MMFHYVQEKSTNWPIRLPVHMEKHNEVPFGVPSSGEHVLQGFPLRKESSLTDAPYG